MADTYFVKCEDCGRRLPGSARKCDVCGGRMTRTAEESYYTPEGPVKKSTYKKAAKKTPDRDSMPVRRPASSTSKASYSTNNSKPLIDRIGDAVDIIADTDELSLGALTQMGQALSGKKPAITNSAGQSQSSSSGSSSSAKRSGNSSNSVVGTVAGALTFIVIIGIIIWGASISGSGDDANYDDDYDGYTTTYVDESVNGNGYTISLDQIDCEEGVELSAYMIVNVNGNKDLELKADNIALDFGSETDSTFQYIYVTDEDDVTQSLYSELDSMTLKAGNEYIIEICYDIETWDQLTLIHNFYGQLPDRDADLDITAINDEYY